MASNTLFLGVFVGVDLERWAPQLGDRAEHHPHGRDSDVRSAGYGQEKKGEMICPLPK